MPQDKLTQQWSEDDHKQADSYTADMTKGYTDQGKPGSSSNRAHADFSYANNIGGTSQLKPVDPPCDGNQFADNPYTFDSADNHYSTKFDRFNNPIPQSGGFHHENATAGEGESGSRMFSDYQKVDGYTGYGVEIPHGQSAAFNNASTIYVANDRADRGQDS